MARLGPALDGFMADDPGPQGPGGPGGDAALPGWVPAAARDYLAHTESGRTIRDIARDARVSPSTVLRRVRRVEASRDDPLVDAALRQLSGAPAAGGGESLPAPSDLAALEAEALPILRRLGDPGTLLAVAREMDKGVVLREEPGGEPRRLAVVPRALAELMALHGWIGGAEPEARIQRYTLATAGRALLRRAGAEAAQGLSEMAAWFDRPRDEPDARLSHLRPTVAESPIAALSRRRDGEGRAFLDREHVVAGDRLREDCDAAVLGGLLPDWDELLARPVDFAVTPPGGSESPQAALSRAAAALAALGPGLADVALRCCALLEGVEQVERRMGWSARSGKVVLRIALDRLRRHYQEELAQGPAFGQGAARLAPRRASA